MTCVICKKENDFTNAIRLQCNCNYCTRCLGRLLCNVRLLGGDLVVGTVRCSCGFSDGNVIFGIGSLIHESYLSRDDSKISGRL